MDNQAMIAALNALLAPAMTREMDEVTVRVCLYRPTGPQYQALVKFRNRTLPWGIGIADTPGDAILGAVVNAQAVTPALDTPTPVTPRVRNRTRTPL